ncbi:hypothetical protein [Streptomyces sp. UNOC14_S4]|uniref:hypothetical protein n=1 Tax=Streptomyces sp. UNOC14_S4 TaxID=2872340 RepID=UPI001E47D9D5|nr:hypothetical protein [Streptomyces sp. UNOC14_S4]MCC3766027.1 hypothetical protein [Streptomyces sp. UNOC14_S4]
MPFFGTDIPDASRDSQNEAPEAAFRRKAARWALVRSQIEAQTRILDDLKRSLSANLQEFGIRDDNGSYIIDLGTTYEVSGKPFTALKLECSRQRTADEDVAERIALEKNLLDRLFPHRRVFDPQEVHVLLQEDLLTEDEVDEIFPEEISYRFVRAGK